MAQLILTGFMGTGKTEVGRRLARATQRPFVDTDKLVEAAAGRSIAEIFATEGEVRFRALEREAVQQAVAVPNAVVATGGGALLDPDSRRLLLSAGPVVCLTATPEEILRRLGDAEDRPLLRGGTPAERLAKIRAILDAREASYSLATHRIDTTGRSVDELVSEIRTLVGAE
ncbi:MAG TPA: shikimate kinase [Candidatus Limnocylindria bacterium]|nr:shikimate kinase [Candidatus Limnocylindria bacterium]